MPYEFKEGELIGFNSTTVQLILRMLPWRISAFRRFNSTTVQLIQRTKKTTILSSRCFNSTTVQLIPGSNHICTTKKWFQFHNGTINTWWNTKMKKTLNKFQFHNGTINTYDSQWRGRISQVFQFHNGTINTSKIRIAWCYVSFVSIPQRYN